MRFIWPKNVTTENDRWEIIMKDEQMCTVLNAYFLSVFTKEYVENVPIPQQLFHGTEKDKLLDIIINKKAQHRSWHTVKCNML